MLKHQAQNQLTKLKISDSEDFVVLETNDPEMYPQDYTSNQFQINT